MQLSVHDLVKEREFGPAVRNAVRFDLDCAEDIREVRFEFIDLERVAGVKRQRDHGFDRTQVDIDAAVVIGHVGGVQFFIIFCSAMSGQIFLRVLVRSPYGGQAGGLCRHDVDAVPVIRRHGSDAGADELHDLVLDVAVLKNRPDESDRDVMRADAGSRLAVEIDSDHAGISHVIGVAKELLSELAAALADGHRTQRAVAGVGVGTEDHPAAAGHRLAHILMYDGDVRGHIDAAVLLRRRKAEHVVILVDGAADRAQGIVTVGQHIGERELLHPGCSRRLDDADKGNIVGRHGVEPDPQVVHVIGSIVGL